jgi:glycosidase
MAPSELARHFDYRRSVLKTIISSHGEVSGNFVTFIDNHDLNARFHNSQYPDQTKIVLTCLMTIQGVPCIYYGTEQGLDGCAPPDDQRREYVREALWGEQIAFSEQNELYLLIQKLSSLRDQYPALRYGRQYFRPTSTDGIVFEYSSDIGGIMAYSRVLNNTEIVIIVNTNTSQTSQVNVLIDFNLNPVGRDWNVVFSTLNNQPGLISTIQKGDYRVVYVEIAPMEAQILVQV